jgi:c-di-GMP-binding flagellar brake protein YcgR
LTEEKRQFPRLNWNVQVQWQKHFDVVGPAPQVSTSKDISQGGIRLILREGVSPGDVLDLEITLGGGKIVRVKGRVVWVDRFEILGGNKDEVRYEGGVQFVEMSEDVQKELERFIMAGPRPAQ